MGRGRGSKKYKDLEAKKSLTCSEQCLMSSTVLVMG